MSHERVIALSEGYAATVGDRLRLDCRQYKHHGVFEILGFKEIDNREVIEFGKVGKNGNVLADNGVQTGKSATRIGYSRYEIEKAVRKGRGVTIERLTENAGEGDPE